MPKEKEEYCALKNDLKNIFPVKPALETQQILVYAAGLILIPLVFHDQLITGTLVNAILIVTSINYSLKKIFWLSFIPSIVVFSTGLLFGGLTSAILLMLPIIWAGNTALMLLVKKLFAKKKENYFLSVSIAAAIKAVLLLASASILFSLSLVPAAFLTIFGITQFVTAESGAVLVWISRMKK